MSYAVLEKELKSLPESYLEDVERYVQFLQYKIAALSNSDSENLPRVKLGLGKGLFKVPDDINFGDDDIREMFGEYV